MNNLKKFLLPLVVVLLLIIGYLLFSEQVSFSDKYVSINQKSASIADFKQEKKVFDKMPDKSMFFSVKNSQDLKNSIKTIVKSISQYSQTIDPSFPDYKEIPDDLNQILKKFNFAGIFIRITGEKIENTDIDKFIEGKIPPMETVQFFNEELCIIGSLNIDDAEIQQSLQDLRQQSLFMITVEKIKDITLVSFGACTDTDFDFVKKNQLQNEQNFVFGFNIKNLDKNMFKKYGDKVIENVSSIYSSDKRTGKMFNFITDIYNKAASLNTLQVVKATQKLLITANISEKEFKTNKIIEFDDEKMRKLAEEYMVGESMIKLKTLTKDVDFSFKHLAKNNIIYHENIYLNPDWSVIFTESPYASILGSYNLPSIAGVGVASGILFVAIDPKSQTNKAESAKIKSILHQERTLAALYYSSNYSYEGFCDNIQTQNLLKQLLNKKCKDSKDAWRIYAELPNHNNYCVDSVGEAIEVSYLDDNSFVCKK